LPTKPHKNPSSLYPIQPEKTSINPLKKQGSPALVNSMNHNVMTADISNQKDRSHNTCDRHKQ